MDANIDKSLKELEQHRLMLKLRKEVGEMVMRYAEERNLDPDTMAGVFFTAGAKISHAECAAKQQMRKEEEHESA